MGKVLFLLVFNDPGDKLLISVFAAYGYANCHLSTPFHMVFDCVIIAFMCHDVNYKHHYDNAISLWLAYYTIGGE